MKFIQVYVRSFLKKPNSCLSLEALLEGRNSSSGSYKTPRKQLLDHPKEAKSCFLKSHAKQTLCVCVCVSMSRKYSSGQKIKRKIVEVPHLRMNHSPQILSPSTTHNPPTLSHHHPPRNPVNNSKKKKCSKFMSKYIYREMEETKIEHIYD